MKLELRNVKHNVKLSEETECFSASLYVDGVKAAECSNRGQGGATDIRFEVRATEDKVNAYVKSLPKRKSSYSNQEFPIDLEYLVNDLLNEYLTEKSIRNACKTKLCFRLKDSPKDSYSAVKFPVKGVYRKADKDWVVGKYGDKIEVIYNDKFGMIAQ
jgi:hypothetical protein